MSKNTTPTLMGGDAQGRTLRKSHANGHTPSQKKHKKPMKSNITNRIRSRRSNQIDVEDDGSDDDGGGSGTVDEAATLDEEPDVSALSDAKQRHIAQRLAGHKDEHEQGFDDMMMMDAPQAVVGASDNSTVAGDEDDYADVEDIGNSDDEQSDVDEEDVLLSAEKDLIDEFEKNEQRLTLDHMFSNFDMMEVQHNDDLARRLGLLQSPEVSNQDVNLDMNADPFYGFAREGNEYGDMLLAAESSLWRMPETARSREGSDPISSTQKRVRFEERKSSSPEASDDEDPNDAFPDLFTPEDDPTLAQRNALAALEFDSFILENDNESFYDFDDEDEKQAFMIDEESDSDDESNSYDSDDDGDTTDEETVEEQIAKMEERKQAANRSVGSAPSTPAPEKQAVSKTPRTPSSSRPTTPRTGRGPRSGHFAADPTRAAITTDVSAGKIKILPPSQPLEKDKAFWERARIAAGSRDGSRRSSFQITHSVSSDSMPSRPFTAKSTLGSMFDGNLDILRNNDTSGIADQIFPHFTNILSSFSSITGTEDSDIENHADMDMQDLLNIDDSDSDDDEHEANPITSPTSSDVFRFPSTPGHERNTSDLLEHFTQNRGVIGSFRQNQHLAKQLSSQASHPAQRASTHEYNALQKGRRGAANTPITPARKKRASQDITPSRGGVRKSMGPPASTSRRPRSRGNSLAGADLWQTFNANPFES